MIWYYYKTNVTLYGNFVLLINVIQNAIKEIITKRLH